MYSCLSFSRRSVSLGELREREGGSRLETQAFESQVRERSHLPMLVFIICCDCVAEESYATAGAEVSYV